MSSAKSPTKKPVILAPVPSVRITDQYRRNIREKLIQRRFGEREKTLQASKSALAVDVYNDAYSAADRRRMNSLPDGWLPTATSINARLGGVDVQLDLPKETFVRLPYEKIGRYGNNAFLVVLPTDHPLSVRWSTIAKEQAEITEEKDRLYHEIFAVLRSVTSLNKLVSIWPEVRDIAIAACHVPASANLPAPQIHVLNKQLGLVAA